MKILVTGANGQLGREMRKFDGKDHSFTFTDVDELDITSREAVLEIAAKNNFDVIINCAAYTNVDAAEDNEQTADLINNKAVRNLAEAAKSIGATLIHVSTDYVFGGSGNTPRSEDDAVNPLGAYGRTKLAGEQSIAQVGCNSIILRTAWLYSPFGKNFVKTMLKLTAEKPQLKVVFDQVGSPTYAADLAKAIMHIINTNQIAKTGIYHFTDEGVCSWYDFTVAIRNIAGNTQCDVQPCHSDEYPSKVERPHFSVLDKSKFKSTFGFDIPHWHQSLQDCIKEIQTL